MLDLSNNYTLPAYVHNITLDRIIRLPSFPEFSLEEGYNVGVEALNSVLNPGTNPFVVPKYEEVKPYYERIEKNANSSEIIEFLFKEKKINEETRHKLDKLNSIILDREDIENYDANINDYIKTIQNNPKLSLETVMICIAGANIAISSKNYWVNAYRDKNSPWNFIFVEENISDKRLWNWLKKVLITVACDVVGGALGGAIGLLASPAGAVAGISVVGGGASAAATKFQE
jgi:hypothetical protein